MTESQFELLTEFNREGLLQLNAGIGDELERKAARSKIRLIAPVRNKLKINDLYANHHLTALVTARWVSADLYDRCGFYRASGRSLREREQVIRMMETLPLPTSKEEYELTWSLHMFRILESVSMHRNGEWAQAATVSESLLERVHLLLDHASSQKESDPDVLFLLDQLGWRTAYASGRHFVSEGAIPEAESAFGKALEFCSDSRKRWENIAGERIHSTAIDHITFWAGTILAGLARAALEQGRLARAMRQLHVARTILSNTRDCIGVAFVDSLLGSIYRQRGEDRRAIEHLTSSLHIFQRQCHERYGRRTFYELIKTFLNAGRFDEAESALRAPLPSKSYLFKSGRKDAADRWDAINLLLWARIKLARRDLAGAYIDATGCLDKIRSHSEDVQVHVHAVLAEIALAQGQYSASVRHCQAGLQLSPVDPTDSAWLIILLAETYLKKKQLESAKHWFDQWIAIHDRVENRLLASRASTLELDLDAEKDSFYVPYREPKNLKYEALNLELRAFLIRQVRMLKRGCTQEEQAAAIGISRQTYASWLSDLRSKDLIDE